MPESAVGDSAYFFAAVGMEQEALKQLYMGPLLPLYCMSAIGANFIWEVSKKGTVVVTVLKLPKKNLKPPCSSVSWQSPPMMSMVLDGSQPLTSPASACIYGMLRITIFLSMTFKFVYFFFFSSDNLSWYIYTLQKISVTKNLFHTSEWGFCSMIVWVLQTPFKYNISNLPRVNRPLALQALTLLKTISYFYRTPLIYLVLVWVYMHWFYYYHCNNRFVSIARIFGVIKLSH